MPLRDYKCLRCGVEIELFVKPTEKAPRCLKCGRKMEAQVGSFRFVLVGPGFHCNDYPNS